MDVEYPKKQTGWSRTILLIFLGITLILIVASIAANEAGAPAQVCFGLNAAAGICGAIVAVMLLFASFLLFLGLALVGAIVGLVVYAVRGQ